MDRETDCPTQQTTQHNNACSGEFIRSAQTREEQGSLPACLLIRYVEEAISRPYNAVLVSKQMQGLRLRGRGGIRREEGYAGKRTERGRERERRCPQGRRLPVCHRESIPSTHLRWTEHRTGEDADRTTARTSSHRVIPPAGSGAQHEIYF